MKIFIFCVFIFFILPNFVLGQNNKHFNLFDAVKFIYKDRDMHHEICDSLPRLSADDRHWFAEEQPQLWSFYECACFEYDQTKLDSAEKLVKKAINSLENRYKNTLESKMINLMRQYLAKKSYFILEAKPNNTPKTQQKFKVDTTCAVDPITFKKFIEVLTADKVVAMNGIKIDEIINQSIKLRVEDQREIMDSLVKSAPFVVAAIEPYLDQIGYHVHRMEVTAHIPKHWSALHLNEFYDGEIIYELPFFDNGKESTLTLPMGSRLSLKNQTILKLIKVGWYFRLSFSYSTKIPEPTYHIIEDNKKETCELTITFHLKQ